MGPLQVLFITGFWENEYPGALIEVKKSVRNKIVPIRSHIIRIGKGFIRHESLHRDVCTSCISIYIILYAVMVLKDFFNYCFWRAFWHRLTCSRIVFSIASHVVLFKVFSSYLKSSAFQGTHAGRSSLMIQNI